MTLLPHKRPKASKGPSDTVLRLGDEECMGSGLIELSYQVIKNLRSGLRGLEVKKYNYKALLYSHDLERVKFLLRKGLHGRAVRHIENNKLSEVCPTCSATDKQCPTCYGKGYVRKGG